MRVLAIDASLRNTGVAIVDANNGKPRSLYFGTIHNASSMRSSSCLVAIRDRLSGLIRKHEPDCCALESVIYVQSYKTAIILGAARGAAILAAAENGLPIFEYTPNRIKQATVGTGAAGKNQVAFMVRALLGLTETPDADAADALAIGLDAPALARCGTPRDPGSDANMNPPSVAAEAFGVAGEAIAGLRVRWLGRMEFAGALALQEEIVAKKREDRSSADELLLLEHEPVYTIGRTPDRSSLLGGTHLPHPLFSINRGGQATYHGPGQLIGYPIIDLRRCGQDLHRYLRWIEQLLIELLADYGIAASRRESLTGVWVENRKIASIGVGVRHWITMHGFALNVRGDLSPFNHIVPCGINKVAMTSIEKETGKKFSVVEIGEALEKLALDRIIDLRVAPEAQPINV